ncbi:hypothetical protein [Chlorogloeopsis fritschii]|uniref:hypothetical protein n=1 Tax=Chlorogloeopsis fritschii TaxID=1124 RepID=UPI0002DB8A04|nr:hypothetical protein [Chlorogloeopsis fritschii]
MLIAHLDRSFNERAESFRALFAVVDSVIASAEKYSTIVPNSIYLLSASINSNSCY